MKECLFTSSMVKFPELITISAFCGAINGYVLWYEYMYDVYIGVNTLCEKIRGIFM